MLKIIDDKIKWEKLVLSFSEANFLQSYNYGAFQEKLGKKVLRVVLENQGQSNNKKAIAQIIIERAKRGNYFSIAGGPLLNFEDKDLVLDFFEALKLLAKEKNVDFIRFRPQITDKNTFEKNTNDLKLWQAPMHLTADLSLRLDLSKGIEVLLKEMRKNTRSSIRKADSLGIKTVISKNPEEIKNFFELQKQVADKHGFVPFGYDFLFEQFQSFLSDDQVSLVHSYLGEDLLASAFVIFYNKEAVYHYGVSTEANAKYPGSYACQKRAIDEAIARGCRYYNFWGIAPEGAKNHRFAGVSLFKRGFGGEEVPYIEAHDIPVTSKYYLTYAFETIRKKMRKL